MQRHGQSQIKDGGRQHHQKKESLEHGRSLPLLLGQVKAPDKPPLSPFLMQRSRYSAVK
jgi:hypothetical protein